jgi:hypothetical protein
MTAIHRRKMLGIMLGGAVVATIGSMIPTPAETALHCPASNASIPNWSPAVPRGVRHRKVCWWGRRRRICCWRWLTPHGGVRLSPTAR